MSKWGIVSKVASLLVAACLLILAVLNPTPTTSAPVVFLALLMPLAFIWFSEQLASRGWRWSLMIDDPPPLMFSSIGWFFLIGVPLLIAVIRGR